MSNFVTTKTVKTVHKVIDGTGPQFTRISVNPFTSENTKGIQLVIGALWDDRYCCALGKKGLKDLIEILQEIHDAMMES